MTRVVFYRSWLSILLVGCTLCCLPNLATAAEVSSSDEQSVSRAKEALGKKSTFPWYDAEKDELRPLRMPKVETPTPQPTPSINPPAINLPIGEILQVLLWIAIAVIVGLLVFAGWKAYRNLKPQAKEGPAGATAIGEAIDPIVDLAALPGAPEGAIHEFLARSKRAYEQGRLREAMIYLFSYQLVELNRQQLIHLTRGKTNRQYLREVRNQPPLASLFEQSIEAFELAFFGNEPLSNERFETVWNRLDDFNRHVTSVGVT